MPVIQLKNNNKTSIDTDKKLNKCTLKVLIVILTLAKRSSVEFKGED